MTDLEQEVEDLSREVFRLMRAIRAVRTECERTDVPAVMGTYQSGYAAARYDILRVIHKAFQHTDMKHLVDLLTAASVKIIELEEENRGLREEAHLIELCCGDWKKRALAAEAQIDAVRKVLEHPRDYRGPGSEWNTCRDVVLHALGKTHE